jgi:NADP-dependent 3-hydroxy acid dehydrogenase YdfG
LSGLAGQVALVAGASGAIGGAIARALAAAGARLVLAGRSADRLAALTRELEPAQSETFDADLADEAAPIALASRAVAAFGVLDILVHAAGEYLAGDLAHAHPADFERLYRINLRAPFLLTRACLPALTASRGQIVFLNSSVGARRGVGLYAATKHGLRGLADTLRAEINPAGVRVLSVYPGRTASAMQEGVARAEGKPYDPARLMRPEDVARAVVAALELPRSAEITDLHLRPMAPPDAG